MKKAFSYVCLAALAAGIIVGIFAPDVANLVSPLGTWYVKVLKVFITPVIFTGIACTIYSTSKKKNHTILKSVALFSVLFICTFLLTTLLVMVINPGAGYAFEDVEWTGKVAEFSWEGIKGKLLPSSAKEIFVDPKVFIVIVFAWLIGWIGSKLKGASKVFDVLSKLNEWILKLLEIFMYLTPLSIFSLISVTVAKYGSILLGMGLKYIGVAFLCSVATLVLVMILPAYIFGSVKPSEYIKKVSKIWLMTITTCSSNATLPYTIALCKDEFGISKEITDVVVPLGCTIHMCGGAVSFALLGLFCAQLYGVEIGFSTYLAMIFAALLINMAAPGIPGGGIVIGASYLQMMGIPIGFIGFYSGIYKFLDMMYTTLNVTGDVTANIILGKSARK